MVTEQHSPGPWGGMASCLLQAQLEPLCPRCPRGQAVQVGSSCWDRAGTGLGSLSRPRLQLAAGRSVQLAGLLHCCAGQGLGRRSVQ